MGNECCSLDDDPWETPGGGGRNDGSSGRTGGGFPSSEQPGAMAVGAKVYINKQDPYVIGPRVAWLPVDIRTGPVTDDVLVVGMNRVYRATDEHGNFLYDPKVDADGFDAVNTLAIVQHVLWMYRRILSLAKRKPLAWLWGLGRPIQVFPHAGKDSNAYYSRGEKALKFFYFSDGVKVIHSCRSWDIVAHETGHAVLDSLQPGWITSSHVQTGALHEAFGDVTSIFSVLDQLDMCELVVAHTKGDLANRQNLLAALGEEFGRGIGRYYGLRNADVDLKISQATTAVHDLSKVFTGAVYDVLVRIFSATIQISQYPPAETLYRAGRHLLSVFLLSVLDAPYKDATFEDVANLMIKKEPQDLFKRFMKEEFTRREVFDEWARPRGGRTAWLSDRTVHACATLKACGMQLRGMADGQESAPASPHTAELRPSSVITGSAITGSTITGSHNDNNNKGSIGPKTLRLSNHVHYEDSTAPVPAPRSTSLGRRNVPQTNNDNAPTSSSSSPQEAPASPRNVNSPDLRGSTEPRNVLRNPNFQDNTTTFKSRSLGYNSSRHVHIQDNVSSFKGNSSLGPKSGQHQRNNYHDAPSGVFVKGSHGFGPPHQANHRHSYQDSRSAYRRNIVQKNPHTYDDPAGFTKGSTGYSNSHNKGSQQGPNYHTGASSGQKSNLSNRRTHQNVSHSEKMTAGVGGNSHVNRSYTQHNPTYQVLLSNRLPTPPPPPSADNNNVHLEFPPPPPETDHVWENQSASFSDNVFESTEI